MLTFSSHPKINLALDILKKDASGFHEIRTIFHELAAPADSIIVEPFSEVVVECDNPEVPHDATNTVRKAALVLKDFLKIDAGAKITIIKKIPLMSGLGGGSSNAAAALKGLAQLWHVDDAEVLQKIADQIGMDCAFFFCGGTARGEHFGEKITPLPSLPKNFHFEVIETGVRISSKLAYAHVNVAQCGKNVEQTKRLIEAINAGDGENILENVHNDFEEFIFETYPELAAKKRELESQKPGKVLLCGSGGSLVRIFYS